MTPGPSTSSGSIDALSDLPPGWTVERTWGPLRFTTHALLRRPDGIEVEWSSRRHRKGLGLRRASTRRRGTAETGWVGRPNPTSWWMAALFGIGSVCFAMGSLPLYFDHFGAFAVAATFFVGSIFFTFAAYLQYHEALAAPEGVMADSPRPRRLASLVGWSPRRLNWWVAAVQLIRRAPHLGSRRARLGLLPRRRGAAPGGVLEGRLTDLMHRPRGAESCRPDL